MKFPPSHIFTYKPHLFWLEEVVNYVSAHATNSELFKLIKEVAQEAIDKQAPNSQKIFMMRAFAYPEIYVSWAFFSSLTFKQGKGKGADGGIPMGVVEKAFDLLVDNGILYKQHTIRDLTQPIQMEQEYTVNEQLIKYLVENDLIYNQLFGFSYIINKYSYSVVKIEVRHGDDTSIGTGWLLDLLGKDDSVPIERLVVTNDHVLSGASSFRVLTKTDNIINHYESELLLKEQGVDIALIRIERDDTIPDFSLSDTVPLLDDIITIGYPKVPLAREAYQLVHRGEVNAQVTDYFNQELLIVSARTAPGNSGSPVIDDTGRVVGMITQELFEKEAFQEKGITPYSACIPIAVINKSLQASKIYQNWLKSTSI